MEDVVAGLSPSIISVSVLARPFSFVCQATCFRLLPQSLPFVQLLYDASVIQGGFNTLIKLCHFRLQTERGEIKSGQL